MACQELKQIWTGRNRVQQRYPQPYPGGLAGLAKEGAFRLKLEADWTEKRKANRCVLPFFLPDHGYILVHVTLGLQLTLCLRLLKLPLEGRESRGSGNGFRYRVGQSVLGVRAEHVGVTQSVRRMGDVQKSSWRYGT